MKKEIEMIADHYGYEPQSRQLIEEMAELIVALNKVRRYTDEKEASRGTASQLADIVKTSEAVNNAVEEIADVEIMLAQIKYLMDCEEAVEEVKQQKIARQIRRMEGENGKR